MIASALAALSLSLAALPQGGVRYRAELAGEAIGVAELRIACSGEMCAATYESRLRLPAESGGEIERRRVEVEVDRDGRWRGGRLAVGRGGEVRERAGIAGAVPAALLEIVLAAESLGGAERCVPFFEEDGDGEVSACVRRDATGRAVADADGIHELIVPGADGFPGAIHVEGRFRFVRDAAALVPAHAPRLAGTRVAGPADPRKARAFCGVPLDPTPAVAAAGLPPPRAAGESCREKTAAYLAAARADGLAGRTAVGVAWDGGAFVWHAWAEIRVGGAWVPVDPSFGQLPARGPRFTLGRYAAGPRDRSAAGARILACWGNAGVEE